MSSRYAVSSFDRLFLKINNRRLKQSLKKKNNKRGTLGHCVCIVVRLRFGRFIRTREIYLNE